MEILITFAKMILLTAGPFVVIWVVKFLIKKIDEL